MKKIIWSATLVVGIAVLSATALAQNNWLLFLPAILAGKGGGTPTTPTESNNKWLLFLPAILAGNKGSGPVVTATGLLNDTGIANTSSGAACGATGEEDCNYGRDKENNDDSDGYAGFSFTKLDSNGSALGASASSWACVQDNVTGLVWEVKTDDGGLRDRDNKYTWYNTDTAVNGGSEGTENGELDTDSYVTAVNTAGLCGKSSGWRMPTIKELLSIVSYSGDHTDSNSNSISIDTGYFPNTQINKYWTSISANNSAAQAWAVTFIEGSVLLGSYKESPLYVRLVHSTN